MTEHLEKRKRRRRVAAARPIPDSFVKGMSNPLRVQIWTILNERTASPTEIAREIGVPREKVIYEVGTLAKLGFVEKKAERKVRGAVENFYGGVARARLDEEEWLGIPDTVKGDLRASLLRTLADDAIEAIAAEQYDARSDAHMSWTPMIVDEEGCGNIATVLLQALEDVIQIQAESAERLRAKDTPGVSYTVSILGYTSADGPRKIGPPRDARRLVKDLSRSRIQEQEQRRREATTERAGGGGDPSSSQLIAPGDPIDP